MFFLGKNAAMLYLLFFTNYGMYQKEKVAMLGFKFPTTPTPYENYLGVE
jgi:hypothetical protein